MDSLPLLDQRMAPAGELTAAPSWSLAATSSASYFSALSPQLHGGQQLLPPGPNGLVLDASNGFSAEVDFAVVMNGGGGCFVLHFNLASAPRKTGGLLLLSRCCCAGAASLLVDVTFTTAAGGVPPRHRFVLSSLHTLQLDNPITPSSTTTAPSRVHIFIRPQNPRFHSTNSFHVLLDLSLRSGSSSTSPSPLHPAGPTKALSSPQQPAAAIDSSSTDSTTSNSASSSPQLTRNSPEAAAAAAADFAQFMLARSMTAAAAESTFFHDNARLATPPITAAAAAQEEEDKPLQFRRTLPALRTLNGRIVEDPTSLLEEVQGGAAAHRDVILRGVNLSGNTKCPIGWATHQDPFAHMASSPGGISFVGRPFPLRDADEHFARLQSWGFNSVRFLITWEAIEHAGPGRFDLAYLDYVERCIEAAGKYGLYVFVDPHQDAWSRFTGGSGAPLWTLELAGLDVNKLYSTGAAFTHFTQQANMRKMTWPQNYQRFACLHMFTLFFSGREFAPDLMVRDNWQPGQAPSTLQSSMGDAMKHVTDFLQDCYFASMREVAKRVARFPHVIGFDSFNEPGGGLVGKNLASFPSTIIPPGVVFRPAEAMATASGVPLKLAIATAVGSIHPFARQLVNAQAESIWLHPATQDVWHKLGLWRRSSSSAGGIDILRPDYFVRRAAAGAGGAPDYNFFRDFLAPFAGRLLTELRSVRRDWLVFVEGDAFAHYDFYWDDASTLDGVVNASHWYDGFALFMGHFDPRWTIDTDSVRPVFGRQNVFNLHLGVLRHRQLMPRDSAERPLALPLLVGEFGMPFDMNNKHMLETGDFTSAVQAFSLYYSLLDALQASSAQWTYCVENTDDYGDMWNLENLSMFARGRGRGVEGFSRPYAPVVCGTRLACRFDLAADGGSRRFTLRYLPSAANWDFTNPLRCTVVYLPVAHFSSLAEITVRNARTVVEKRADGNRMLYLWAGEPSSPHHGSSSVVVEPVELVVVE